MGSSYSKRDITLVNDENAGVIKLSESLAHRLRGQILEGRSPESVAPKTAVEAKAPTVPPFFPPSSNDSFHISHPPSVPESLIPTHEATSPNASVDPIPIPIIPTVTSNLDEGSNGSNATSKPPTPPAKPAAPLPEPPSESVAFPPTPPPTPPPEVTVAPEMPVNLNITSKETVPSIQLNENGSFWNNYADDAHLAMYRLREEKDEQMKQQEEQWRDRLASREKEYMDQAQLTHQNVTKSIKNVESLFLKTTTSPVCQDKQDDVMKCFADNPKQPIRCADLVNQFSRCVNVSQLEAVLQEKS